MVYKIRVILDSKDSIFRDIEIKEKQTLWNLHLGIKSAFSLQGEDLSMFTILNSPSISPKSSSINAAGIAADLPEPPDLLGAFKGTLPNLKTVIG
jgi:hypothetical protein